MNNGLASIKTTLLFACTLGVAVSTASAADDYKLDESHTGIVFVIKHLNMSYTYGRFNESEGVFAIDTNDPTRSSFSFTVKTASVDTGHKKRDEHLRSPDFFNAKQFPVITFKSTAVEAVEQGYRVAGDLTLHGVSRSLTVELEKLGEGKDPWGNDRIGFATELRIKRSDFGIDHMLSAVGDDVRILISFEGIRQ